MSYKLYLMLSIGIIGILLTIVIITQNISNKTQNISNYNNAININNCSLTLGVNKPSNIKLPKGLYSSRALNIIVYYCKVEGFDEIRLVFSINRTAGPPSTNKYVADKYEFVIKPNTTASITFLISVNQQWVEDNKLYSGVELLRHFGVIDEQFVYDGVRVYLSDMIVLSDTNVLVTYTFEADKDVKGATYYVPLLTSVTLFGGLYLSTINPA